MLFTMLVTVAAGESDLPRLRFREDTAAEQARREVARNVPMLTSAESTERCGVSSAEARE